MFKYTNVFKNTNVLKYANVAKYCPTLPLTITLYSLTFATAGLIETKDEAPTSTSLLVRRRLATLLPERGAGWGSRRS